MFRIRLFFIFFAAIGLIARADAQAVRRDSAKAFQKIRECSAQMGPNVITFSFYQPTQSRDQFCEDVPETGPTTIVVDTMQDELRDMMVEIRIVEAAPNGDDEAAPNEAYLPPAQFQTGVIQLEHDFKKQGDYVALVRARSEDGRKEYNARFFFSVGEEFLRAWAAVAVATVVGVALGAGWYAHAFGRRSSKKT
ncbi:hypothetical protein [Methylocystis suflitae]|uniref:hypothetical protein n=1 Tax=Methylocystis suflitae TaxID=2951405 RepID=UPI00210C1B25|nr:hypothetical protein [Methylocystis suflitae]MCQ4188010.1 hypothetical protein [Methylocystis suflitae]